jgi:hypothetical protein
LIFGDAEKLVAALEGLEGDDLSPRLLEVLLEDLRLDPRRLGGGVVEDGRLLCADIAIR